MDALVIQSVSSIVEKAVEKSFEKLLLNNSETLAQVKSTQLSSISEQLSKSFQNPFSLIVHLDPNQMFLVIMRQDCQIHNGLIKNVCLTLVHKAFRT